MPVRHIVAPLVVALLLGLLAPPASLHAAVTRPAPVVDLAAHALFLPGGFGHDEHPADIAPPHAMLSDGLGGPVDVPPGDEAEEGDQPGTLVRLKLNGTELIAELDTPVAPGSYELIVELRTRDGASLDGGNEAVEPLTVRLWRPLAVDLGLPATTPTVRAPR